MRLTVFNGSPRGKHGNTAVFLDHFLKGFLETPGNSYDLHELLKEPAPGKHAAAFAEAETVLLAFPLYIDCMPAMVKGFIETLAPYCSREGNPDILFLIQSGFPEAVHLRALERYLSKLSRRLGCRQIGTIVRGGGEALRFMPAPLRKLVHHHLYRLGRAFGATHTLDKHMLARLAFPERLSPSGLFMVSLLRKLGVLDAGWNQQLKANNAFERRFDTPYLLQPNQPYAERKQ